MRTYHAGDAIVECDGCRYIAVALADSPEGGVWMVRLIIFDPENVARDALPSGTLQPVVFTGGEPTSDRQVRMVAVHGVAHSLTLLSIFPAVECNRAQARPALYSTPLALMYLLV